MKLKYLIYTITLTSLTACSDFLEPKSQSKYIPKDANALQEMLIGEAYPQQGNTKFLAYLEILADDIDQNQVEGYEFPENEQGKMETFEVLYSWQPNMFEMQQKLGQEPSNTWGNLYEYILGANAALDYTDEVSGTEAEKNYIKAQSYALRAFFYYMLVNQYGLPYNYDKESLGVPLKIDSKMRDEGEVLMKRNTVEEVYLQIVADLNEAERLFLPGSMTSWQSAGMLRPTACRRSGCSSVPTRNQPCTRAMTMAMARVHLVIFWRPPSSRTILAHWGTTAERSWVMMEAEM